MTPITDRRGQRRTMLQGRVVPLVLALALSTQRVMTSANVDADTVTVGRYRRRAADAPPIDYGGTHPFELMAKDRERRERALEAEGDDRYYWMEEQPMDTPEVRFNLDRYQPIRIKFTTEYLPLEDPKKRDHNNFLIDYVLPQVADFWSQTLSVYRAKRLFVNSDYCIMAEAKDFVFGETDVDLHMFVVADYFCDGTTHSLAESCDWDDYDRPIGGNIYFCYDAFPKNATGGFSDNTRRAAVTAAIHEVAHVLGIHEADLPFYYDSATGEPRTERPVNKTTASCTNGATKEMEMPSDTTVTKGTTADGIQFYQLVTPRVLQVARNHFGCQEMEGVRLENQPTTEGTCLGNHLEERLFFHNFMTAIASNSAIPAFFNPVTLAMFEDTGWYKANYSRAETSPFGRGRGCDFVDKPCIDKGTGEVPPVMEGTFCNSTDRAADFACDPTHSIIATCDLMDYAKVNAEELAPPPVFQYFKDNSNLGAQLRQADYCPTWTHFVWECKGKDPPRMFDGESYGKDNSRCINTIDVGRPLCMESSCNEADHTVEIYVAGATYVCSNDGEIIEITETNTTIVCPKISDFCPDLVCPSDCSGRGICNYDAEPIPKCECHDDVVPLINASCDDYEVKYFQEYDEEWLKEQEEPEITFNRSDIFSASGVRSVERGALVTMVLSMAAIVAWAVQL